MLPFERYGPVLAPIATAAPQGNNLCPIFKYSGKYSKQGVNEQWCSLLSEAQSVNHGSVLYSY